MKGLWLVFCLVIPGFAGSQAVKHKPAAPAKVTAAIEPQPLPKWSQEPDSFWGIKFGSPLAASFGECAKKEIYGRPEYSYDEAGTDKICFEESYGDKLVRSIPGFGHISVREVDGKVEHVDGSTRSSYTEDTLAALIAKFGEAHSVSSETVRSKGGVEYINHIYTWQGPRIRIIFQTVGTRVDQSLLSVSTAIYDQFLSAQEKKSRKGIADTF
jgi:hypothetical protein